ncbi:MAG: Holliday junction branch migration DNA helicase RuvB, partial [Coriobacteriia bacterium]|nr:Holliday junction branch migration DNA helicase RuvB [Coriobacteriia bacterium]
MSIWEADDIRAASDADAQDLQRRAMTPVLTEDDLGLDRSLRPRTLEDYIGQTKIKENLSVLVQAAKQR